MKLQPAFGLLALSLLVSLPSLAQETQAAPQATPQAIPQEAPTEAPPAMVQAPAESQPAAAEMAPAVEAPAPAEPVVDMNADRPATEPAASEETALAKANWTWMTVAGWSALAVGTVSTVVGAVVLSNPSDNLQMPLGLGAFSAGALIGVVGAVLLYLDSEE